jgi:uncharacterized membrane protein
MASKKLISENDIWRVIGVIMILSGQFLPRFKYSGYSIEFESNEVIIAGVCILVIMPIINRWLQSRGEK